MITVNNRKRLSWSPGLTVEELLGRLNYTHTHLVVSINGSLVEHDAYATATIPDEADVRIIHLMAGG
jgi:thiamine biosynthesis protein ThiS